MPGDLESLNAASILTQELATLRRRVPAEEETALFRELRETADRAAMLTNKVGPLAEADHALLEQGRRREAELRAEAVNNYLGLVRSAVNRFARANTADWLDLFQLGSVALWRATSTFDPERGFRFSTYATRAIHHAVVAALREARARTHQSLDQLDPQPDPVDPDPGVEDQAISGESARHLRAIVAELSETHPRELSVWRMHHGLDGTGERRTFEEIGRMLGLRHRTQVMRLERRAGLLLAQRLRQLGVE